MALDPRPKLNTIPHDDLVEAVYCYRSMCAGMIPLIAMAMPEMATRLREAWDKAEHLIGDPSRLEKVLTDAHITGWEQWKLEAEASGAALSDASTAHVCPDHECGYVLHPDTGYCRFHEEWAKGFASTEPRIASGLVMRDASTGECSQCGSSGIERCVYCGRDASTAGEVRS